MRIKIKLKGKDILPINNQHLLNSYVHNCLGRNNKYHDAANDYSISFLSGGKKEGKDELLYEDNAFFTVSSLDEKFINDFLLGVLNNQKFNENLSFDNVEQINEKFYNGWNYFLTLSPFLIKYHNGEKYTFLELDDKNLNEKLKKNLINKLSKIDKTLDLADFDIKVNLDNFHKIKRIMIKNVLNVSNLCYINIFTNKKVAELLYNIGIGQSTGSGFGTIYKIENKRFYKDLQTKN